MQLWDRETGTVLARSADLFIATPIDNGYIGITKTHDAVRFDRAGKRLWATHIGGELHSIGVEVSGDHVLVWLGKSASILAADSGAMRVTFESDAAISRGVFDIQGRRIATVGGPTIQVWNVADGHLIAGCATPSPRSQAVRFTPDGDKVVAGGDDGVVRICDVASGTVAALSGHTGAVAGVRVDRSGTVVASASFDGTVRLWRVATGESLGVLAGHRGAVRALELSSDGRMVATGGDDATVRIWDLESATQLATLEGHTGRISDLHWEDAALESAAQDGTIRRWNIQRAIQVSIGHPHQQEVVALEVTPDGSQVLSRSADRSTVLFNAETWTAHDAIADHRDLSDAALLPTNEVAGGLDTTLFLRRAKVELSEQLSTMVSTPTYVVTASDHGTIQRWSFDGKLLGQVHESFTPEMIQTDSRGAWIVLRPTYEPNGPIIVLDAATMREVARPVGKITALQDVVIDRDRLAVGHDHELQLFQTGTWKPIRTIHFKDSVQKVALVPDGRMVVASDGGTVSIWDHGGQLVTSLPGSGRATALALSHDARLLAVGTKDGSVDVWDLDGYHLVATMHGHRMGTWSVAFSPDDRRLYSGGEDGRVASWHLSHTTRTPAELAHLVKCRVPLQLSGESVLPREIDYDDPSCR